MIPGRSALATDRGTRYSLGPLVREIAHPRRWRHVRSQAGKAIAGNKQGPGGPYGATRFAPTLPGHRRTMGLRRRRTRSEPASSSLPAMSPPGSGVAWRPLNTRRPGRPRRLWNLHQQLSRQHHRIPNHRPALLDLRIPILESRPTAALGNGLALQPESFVASSIGGAAYNVKPIKDKEWNISIQKLCPSRRPPQSLM